MSCQINASSTSGLVITSDLSGVLTFAQNGVALPNGGVAPAFSAYAATTTSMSNGVSTKVLFDTEEFDTNNNFASSRFTPTVAGYYQINSSINLVSPAANMLVIIFKKGIEHKRGAFANSTALNNVNVSSIVYCDGSTDYIEIYVYQSSGGAVNTGTGTSTTWFNGCLVRGA